MKTLFLCLLVAIGVAAILYGRVHLGMGWADMSEVIQHHWLPRMASIAILLAGMVGALAFANRDQKPR